MHQPTPHARRVAALRYQAEQLLRDAAAWGYDVRLDTLGSSEEPYVIEILPRVEYCAAPNCDCEPGTCRKPYPPAPASTWRPAYPQCEHCRTTGHVHAAWCRNR